MWLSGLGISPCLSHSRSHTSPFSPLTLCTLTFYSAVTLFQFRGTTRSSAVHPEATSRCPVKTRQGNPSCHLPCSHSLSYASCRASLVPNASNSTAGELQWLQNANLRIATGSLQIASISHLQIECAMLSVSDSLSLACRQHLAGALHSEHLMYSIALLSPRD